MVDYNDEEDVIGESPEYSVKSEFSKARIVYDACNKATINRAKEMRAGYFNTNVSKEGMPIKIWITDAREEFINSVNALRLLLNPECARDEVFKTAENKLNEEESKLLDKYSYKEKGLYYKKDLNGNTNAIYRDTGIKYMPEDNAVVIVPNKYGKAEQVMGGWNNMKNSYIIEKLNIADKRFALLNDLIDRLNYFKQGLSYG